MALIACTACGNQVSDDAKSCPKCGHRMKAPSRWYLWVLGVPLGGFLIMMVIGAASNSTPEGQARLSDRHAYEACMREFDNKLTPPGAKVALQSACRQMHDDYVRKWGSEP